MGGELNQFFGFYRTLVAPNVALRKWRLQSRFCRQNRRPSWPSVQICCRASQLFIYAQVITVEVRTNSTDAASEFGTVTGPKSHPGDRDNQTVDHTEPPMMASTLEHITQGLTDRLGYITMNTRTDR